MTDFFYKTKLFGYHEFRIETAKSKTEVVDIIKANIGMGSQWSDLISYLREAIKNKRGPSPLKRFYGDITENGFVVRSDSNRRLPGHGTIEEKPDGTIITVVFREPVQFVLGSGLLLISIAVVTAMRGGGPISRGLMVAFVLLFLIVRVVNYAFFRKDVWSIRRFLKSLFSLTDQDDCAKPENNR